jgi:hypothetical protein
VAAVGRAASVNPYVHEPTDACRAWHCHWHNVDEAAVGYRICGECLHTYATYGELKVAFYLQVMRPRGQLWPTEDQEFWFCPLCAHDF